VIHRDLKPDNIMLERNGGRAVLTDFGIARRLETSGLTAAGELIGTPEYMSPEQACGSALDPRTDLYSLGVVGFFALSGRVPFESDSVPDLLVQHATAPPPALAPLAPGVPRALSQSVMRCLEKEPAGRFADARVLADALSAALETRREIPAPVRAFVKDSLEIRATGCLFIAGVTWIGPTILALLFRAASIAYTPYGFLLGFLAMGGVLGGVPLANHVRRIRRLIRAGYGIEDVQAGAQADLDKNREEIAFTVGRETPPVERLVRGAGKVAGGLAVAVLLAGVIGRITFFASPVLPAIVTFGLGLWVVGIIVGQRRRDVLGERRVKYWKSRFARWVFKLAGKGLTPPPQGGGGATHRPTELSLAFAAEDLYARLPKETQRALPELPATLKRLEQQARALRTRIEGLEQSLADLAQDTRPEAEATRRALVADLTAARDATRGHLSETVAALETIRLDLLRLRAGAGNVDRITSDLAAALEIGGAVDRLLAAGEDVEKALKP
jgi:serine/threonine-protein kinase